jgi:hypothetical protein
MPLSSSYLHELVHIDRQIEEMLDRNIVSSSIHSLRMRRNFLASGICRLPEDVTQDLLRYIVRSSLVHDALPLETFYTAGAIIPWINITGVCSSLRALAISLPALWCFIDLNRCPEWTDLCIRRSQGTPIHLSCFFMEARRAVLASDLVDRYLSRACEFRFNGRHLANGTQNLFHRPLPLLQGFYSQNRDPYYVSLSMTFLGGQTSSLTRLELRRVNIEDDSIRFPELRTLILASITTGDQPQRLMRLIQASPRVEHLSLSFILVSAPYEAFGSIQLPCLLTSLIVATLPWIIVLLDSLPVAQNKYEVSVQKESRRSMSVTTSAQITLHQRALESFMRVTRTCGDQALTASLELDAFWSNFGKSFWAFTLQSPSTWPCLVTFTHVYVTIEGLTPIMSLAKSVTIHANAAKAFISHVTIRPGAFGSLEHVVLKQHPDGPYREYEGFLAWLRMRQDLGEPLRGLDIHGTSPFHALGVDAGTLVRCGMVGEVMQDGRKI